MNKPYVRPDVQAYLDRRNAQPTPLSTVEFLAKLKTMGSEFMTALDAPIVPIAVVRDLAIPGPCGDIQMRLYDPREQRRPGPVMVFFHGGGFCKGSIDTHASLAAELAHRLDMPVVSIEYRLAPDFAWPAAPDDAEAASRWIAANGPALNLEVTGLVLCGDSAGGNLASVVALALRDKPAAASVLLQVPIYPATEFGNDTESKRLYSDGYGLDSRNIAIYDVHYQPDPGDWRASPLVADQSGLPPTVVITASLDPLRDEGRAYAAKCAEAGVPTLFWEAQGQVHGFATFRKVIPSAVGDLDTVICLIRAGLALSP